MGLQVKAVSSSAEFGLFFEGNGYSLEGVKQRIDNTRLTSLNGCAENELQRDWKVEKLVRRLLK